LRSYSTAVGCAGAATDAAAEQGLMMMMMVVGVLRRAVSCQGRMAAARAPPACRR